MDSPDPRDGVRRAGRDWVAVGLLLLGGIVVPIVGWLVGATLLWRSPVWTASEKLAATLLWPGGYFTVAYVSALLLDDTGPSPTGEDAVGEMLFIAGYIGFALAPLLVTIFLCTRLVQRTRVRK